MKHFKIIRSIYLITCLLVLFSVSTLFVSANSAQKQWSGIYATGVMTSDEECPVAVEKELLTFDIGEFPKSSYYYANKSFFNYGAMVTAEYTFYNPADYQVTATLVFPFGKIPDYSGVSAKMAGETEAAKYGVYINGEEIDAVIRHTISHAGFDFEEELPRLRDWYIEDSFYKPDTPVYCQTFTVSGMDSDNKRATAAFVWNGNAKLIEYNFGVSSIPDGLRIKTDAENGKKITLWFIGSYPGVIGWNVYEDSSCERKISGKVELTESLEMSFEEFAMQKYNSDSGISKVDWYNAMVDNLNHGESIQNTISGVSTDFNITNDLLRWYEYEITLQPGERITNTVTAPLYPSIDKNYSPTVYGYTYLLSPAKTWSDFGSLDIVINTPYFIVQNEKWDFQNTEDGYALSLDGLPDGELEFALCKSEEPEENHISLPNFLPIWIIMFLVPVIVISVVIHFTGNNKFID